MSVYAVLKRVLARYPRTLPNGSYLTTCPCYHSRPLSSKAPVQKIVKEVDPNTGELKKKKTSITPKITLLSGDSISVTTLEAAEHLSKRRDLKLVKIVDLDAKTQRPVYKLMTGIEYHAEDLKQREQRKKDKQSQFIKGEKVLLLNSKISQHDLETQLRKTVKWIAKMLEVRVIINGDRSNMGSADAIYAAFEKHFKAEGVDARLVQKRVKDADLKFQILPPKKDSDL